MQDNSSGNEFLQFLFIWEFSISLSILKDGFAWLTGIFFFFQGFKYVIPLPSGLWGEVPDEKLAVNLIFWKILCMSRVTFLLLLSRWSSKLESYRFFGLGSFFRMVSFNRSVFMFADSSACSNLLLKPPSEIFSSVIMLFSSRMSWCFLFIIFICVDILYLLRCYSPVSSAFFPWVSLSLWAYLVQLT